ncbi:RnfABCDGE type electron transport complex subunit D [bacterium]|nr:RnfABCDGE type electron transport complex subunit D [candidate division CSSED10-310 bacterium]
MEMIKLNVAMGPHIHDGSRANKIMIGYLVALAPAAIWSAYIYGVAGIRSLILAAGSAVLWEWLARIIMKRNSTLHDLSALVEGFLIGMILPPNVSWWIVIITTFFAIIIAKQIFGGIGYYPFNPVLIGIAIVSVSWPNRLLSHSTLSDFSLGFNPVEPLWAFKAYGQEAANAFSRLDLLLGHQVGGFGTGAVLLLAIGALYLLIRGFISASVFFSYLLGVYMFQGMFYLANSSVNVHPDFYILGGMTFFAATFLASNFTTCPVNPVARIIYGAGAGLLTVLIRKYGVFPDGTIFAILIMNLFHPLIDRIKKPVTGLDVESLQFES